MTRQRGFTLVELLIGMVLLGVVSTAIFTLLVNNQRMYRTQTQRVDLNEAIRAAAFILPSELRELDASDGDILDMSSTSITYKAMRGGGILCSDANAAGLTVTLLSANSFGQRSISATQDSILIFAENDQTTRLDNKWLHGSVSSVVSGTACSGSAASTAITVTSNSGTDGTTTSSLTGVYSGAPVRYFEVAKLSLYDDGSGSYWLGLSTYNKGTASWGSTQPLVGPLTSNGLAFTYYNSANATATTKTCVARIGIVIRGQTAEAVRNSSGVLTNVTDSLMTSVALRNNNRSAAACT